MQSAKKRLGRLEKLSFQIERKKLQLEELRDLQGRTSGIDYSGEKVSTSFHGYVGEARAIEIMELERNISDQIVVFNNLKNELIDKICLVDNIQYVKILTYRYVDYMSLEEIAVEMNYSYDHIRHMHGRALQAYEKVNTQ